MTVTATATRPVPAPPAPERTRTWGHRPALDGLRAIAVAVVVLFHAELDTFANGFIGVDMFFVLSGFVVTNMLLGEIERTGSVVLRRFYARRIRRLMPAAFVVIISTSLAYLLLFPLLERMQIVRDAQASLLYLANWQAIFVSNDYFAADGDQSPFLHFWSLSIEEQFYIFFPVLLLGLFALQRRVEWPRVVPAGLGILIALSVVAQFLNRDDVSRAYYGTDTRFYQLLAGCLLAYALRRSGVLRMSTWIPGAVAAGALGMFALLATSFIEVSLMTRGLLAAGLTVAIIWGLEGHLNSGTARQLSRPTMVYLGAISYGIYLWHWPVILILNHVLDISPLTTAVLASVLACSLAAFSYQVLESPIRSSARLNRVPKVVIAVGIGIPFLAAFTLVPRILESEQRPQLAAASAGATNADSVPGLNKPVPDIDFAQVDADRIQTPDCGSGVDGSCLVRSGSGPKVLLIGDSHARMYLPALERIAEDRDWTLAANVMSACAWQAGLNARPDRTPEQQAACTSVRDPWYQSEIAKLDPDVVLLAGRSWQTVSGGGVQMDELISAQDPALAGASTDQVAAATSRATVDLIAANTNARIVIIEPTPESNDVDPLACLSGAATLAECAFDAGQRPPVVSEFRAMAKERDDTWTVNFLPVVCPDAPVCTPVAGDVPIWRDEQHLNRQFVARSSADFQDVLLDSGAFD